MRYHLGRREKKGKDLRQGKAQKMETTWFKPQAKEKNPVGIIFGNLAILFSHVDQ